MRNYAALVVFFFAAVFGVFAQDGAPTNTTAATPVPTWSGSWNAELKNHYYGRILCGVFADQTVVQQSLELDRVSGKTTVSILLWDSKGFHNNFRSFADETDAGIGVTRKIGAFAVSGSAWMFFLYPGAGTHVPVVDGKISRTFARDANAVTPYAELQHDGLTNHGVPYHGGWYPMAGADYERQLGERTFVTAHYHEGYDVNGGFGKNKGAHLFYAEIAPRIRITSSFAVIPIRAAFGGSWNDRDRAGKMTWSTGFTKTF